MDILSKYFKANYGITDPSELVKVFRVRKVLKRHETLIRPNQRTNFLAFITKGAFRVYFHDDQGFEITTWFSFANSFVTDLLSYYHESPAAFYVEAIEESEVLITQKEDLENLYKSHPANEIFGRKFAENGMVLLMQRMLDLQTKSAKERYLDLLNKPAYLQKIPLKYLATYLGITDTSLSRIRKEISDA